MPRYEWDASNADHVARHGVTPEEVEEVIESGPLEWGQYTENGERRASVIGQTKGGRVLYVVVTARGRALRAVTAHVAPREMREVWQQYKEQFDE